MMRVSLHNLVRASSLALGIALCGASGCSAPDKYPSPGMGDFVPAPENDPQISVLAPELREWLGFQSAIVVADGERPMMVEQPVRNMTANRYFIQYRILFYDANGIEQTPTMSWRFIDMEPKQIVRLKANSLSTGAVNYRIELKWAR